MTRKLLFPPRRRFYFIDSGKWAYWYFFPISSHFPPSFPFPGSSPTPLPRFSFHQHGLQSRVVAGHRCCAQCHIRNLQTLLQHTSYPYVSSFRPCSPFVFPPSTFLPFYLFHLLPYYCVLVDWGFVGYKLSTKYPALADSIDADTKTCQPCKHVIHQTHVSLSLDKV